jgi:hypothetical protein
MKHKLAPSYAHTNHFSNQLGSFYTVWIVLEMTIEYQIGRLLKLPYEETHIIVAGMEFGRKANLLRILLGRSGNPDAGKITTVLNEIQNTAKRNIFTHSLLHSIMDEVTFIHRKTDAAAFSATKARFTSDEFEAHVLKITKLANELGVLLKIDNADYQAFCEAALLSAK